MHVLHILIFHTNFITIFSFFRFDIVEGLSYCVAYINPVINPAIYVLRVPELKEVVFRPFKLRNS